jgi:hypothetical protein
MSDVMIRKSLMKGSITDRIVCAKILSFAEKLKVPWKVIFEYPDSLTIKICGRQPGCLE